MGTATKPKPPGKRTATAMRAAAKVFDQVAETLEPGTIPTGYVAVLVDTLAEAASIHEALSTAAVGVDIWGPSDRDKVHLTYGFDGFDVAVYIPTAVADQVVPKWRAVAAS